MINRICSLYNRLFALWVVLGGIAAYFIPGFFLPLKRYMDFFFGLTMFGIGMVMNFDDFKNIFRNFMVVIVGVFSQFTIMPFAAFFVARLLSLPRELSLGLILTGSAPGAMASNVLCYLAGADVAYSVSLTTCSTLLSPILTPLLTLFLAHTFFHIPFWAMFCSIMKMVLLPLMLGLWIRRTFSSKIDPVVAVFPAISTTFIVFICSLVIALNRAYLPRMSGIIVAAVLALNIFGLSLGYAVAKLARFDILKRRALSIEIGMQNAGLGSVLALKHFSEQAALPAVLFVFTCIFTASFLVQFWSRRAHRTSAA